MSAKTFRERQVSAPSVVVATQSTSTYNAPPPAKLSSVSSELRFAPTTLANVEYPVTGIVGRCFLRVCMLVDMVTSWNRRYQRFQSPFANTATSEKRV